MNCDFRSFRRISVRLAAFLSVLFVVTIALAAKPPITMEDLLNAQNIGGELNAARFAPNGITFAFGLDVPIAKQDNWGYDYAGLVRTRVFVVRRAGSAPKEIPNTSDVHYSLVGERAWSPDGRELLLLATTRKGFGLAVYDVASGKIVRLPGNVSYVFPKFAWLQDDRLIYFAIPESVHEGLADAQVLANLNARWNAAWYGNAPQVTVSSTSPVFKTSDPPSGTLMLADPRHGTSKKLATGNYYVIATSPNDRYVAVVRGAGRMPMSMSYHGRRGELQILELDAESGSARLLYHYRDIDVSTSTAAGKSLSWSPSGTRLLMVGHPVTDGHSGTHLYVVDAGNGKLHQITSPALSFGNGSGSDWGMSLQIGWLGERPMAVATHKMNSVKQAPRNPAMDEAQLDYGGMSNLRFDVYAFIAGHPENLTTFAKTSVNRFLVPRGAGYAMVIADGALWKVAPGVKPSQRSSQGAPTIVGFGTDRRYPELPADSAYYRSGQHERVSLYALGDNGKPKRVVLDFKSGKLTPLNVRGRIVATAPDQLETLSKFKQGWSSTLLLNGNKESTVLTVNADLKGKAVAQVKSFTFTYKGKPLNGWVVLPLDAKPGVPSPAVVSVYGGIVYGAEPPSEAEAGVSLPIFSGQLLATQGYAVIYPSTPLGPGSSTDTMGTLAGEVVAAVDALAAKGIVDPKRVGVIGQSFGGFSTAAILAKRSDRFKAGIAMAGIYDWMFGWGMLPMGKILTDDGDIYDGENKMIEIGQSRLGKPFWQAPDAYMRNSPIFDVENINSPLLLLHGDLDLGVTGLPGAERMYNALLRAGKTTTLVRYWGQGHVAQSAWAIRDQWFRITTWFGHYLKNAPQASKPVAAKVPERANYLSLRGEL